MKDPVQPQCNLTVARPMNSRSYWIKLGCCVGFLIVLALSSIYGDWHGNLGWPWNGLLHIGTAVAEVLSPFVFIYLVILATKLK